MRGPGTSQREGGRSSANPHRHPATAIPASSPASKAQSKPSHPKQHQPRTCHVPCLRGDARCGAEQSQGRRIISCSIWLQSLLAELATLLPGQQPRELFPTGFQAHRSLCRGSARPFQRDASLEHPQSIPRASLAPGSAHIEASRPGTELRLCTKGMYPSVGTGPCCSHAVIPWDCSPGTCPAVPELRLHIPSFLSWPALLLMHRYQHGDLMMAHFTATGLVWFSHAKYLEKASGKHPPLGKK